MGFTPVEMSVQQAVRLAYNEFMAKRKFFKRGMEDDLVQRVILDRYGISRDQLRDYHQRLLKDGNQL